MIAVKLNYDFKPKTKQFYQWQGYIVAKQKEQFNNKTNNDER